MDEREASEFARGVAIGQEVMAHFTNTMTALEAESRALAPVDGDPGWIFRARLGLLDEGLAEIDRVTDQVGWLLDGAMPAEVTEVFAGMRVTLEQTRRNVENDLIAAIAGMN